MIYTSEQMDRIRDRLNNGRQMIQSARCMSHRAPELIEEAHRIFGELAALLEEGKCYETWRANVMTLYDMVLEERNEARRKVEAAAKILGGWNG
jgi:flagellin-specific chaperone FliS